MIDHILHEKVLRLIELRNGDSAYVEHQLLQDGMRSIAGIDEAGRGPLAGPVVAAAVVLPVDVSVDGVRDSKLIPRQRRTKVALAIESVALDIGIGIVEPEEIDRVNILQATKKAMQIAADSLKIKPDVLLIDGKHLDCENYRTVPIVKGDLCCRSIAAASIIAKVRRDAIMDRLHEQYPEYGFNKHKGYPTVQHKKAIRKYGLSPVHRRTFGHLITHHEEQETGREFR